MDAAQRARAREVARECAQTARDRADTLIDGYVGGILQDLADAVELLADVSEAQEVR